MTNSVSKKKFHSSHDENANYKWPPLICLTKEIVVYKFSFEIQAM